MAQVFHRSANALVRSSAVLVTVGAVLVATLGTAVYWSPAMTMVGIHRDQPIPFSHARHVGGNGMDCRYCHTSVEHSSFAGIPPTKTCMTCHSQILTDAPMLEPARESWKSDTPLEWARIYDLPDFVYFDHSIHVAKGVGCTTCHGSIGEMPLTYKAETLHMRWCLECHRAPEKFLRPQDEIYNSEWVAPADQIERGRELVEAYGIRVEQLYDCSVCHR